MKIAIVHDYLKEYGGAERVLEALTEIFPEAPIYTAFYKKGSFCYEKFKHKNIKVSWVHYIPFFATKLHSPLRFLAPWIWGSFNFSEYDVVISSASWYVTKGFGRRNSSHPELGSGSDSGHQPEADQPLAEARMTKKREISHFVRNDKIDDCKKKGPIEICYCHTPPRWLYGYRTSIEWQKFWPIRVYGMIIGHFMRMYDFDAAQRVDYFIANSEEVRGRIKKFYRRDATVIYPPVSLNSKFEIRNPKQIQNSKVQKIDSGRARMTKGDEGEYYFIVSRIVGGKGLDLAVEAAEKMGFKLKIAGVPAGYYTEYKKLIGKASNNEIVTGKRGSPIKSGMTTGESGMTSSNNVEFLGYVTDEELSHLYANAKAFLALATDEDFGITPVEAMSMGTPVIAFNGGGYKETVIDPSAGSLQQGSGQAGQATGVFFNEPTADSLIDAIRKFERMKIKPENCIKQAQKFSKEEFERKIKEFIEKIS